MYADELPEENIYILYTRIVITIIAVYANHKLAVFFVSTCHHV